MFKFFEKSQTLLGTYYNFLCPVSAGCFCHAHDNDLVCVISTWLIATARRETRTNFSNSVEKNNNFVLMTKRTNAKSPPQD